MDESSLHKLDPSIFRHSEPVAIVSVQSGFHCYSKKKNACGHDGSIECSTCKDLVCQKCLRTHESLCKILYQ